MRVIFWQGPVLTEVINPTQALPSAFHRFLMNPSWVGGEHWVSDSGPSKHNPSHLKAPKEPSPLAPHPELVPNNKSSFPSFQPAPSPLTVKLSVGIQDDIVSRTIFVLSKSMSQPPSHPQLCSFTPQYGTLPVSTRYLFFFLRCFQWEDKKGGRGGKLFDNSCDFIVSNASINEFKPEPVYALPQLAQP